MDAMLLMKSQRNVRQGSIPDHQDYETLQKWHIRWY